MLSYIKIVGLIAVLAVIGFGCWHYTSLTDRVKTLTVERDAEKARADANAKALETAEADRKVAVATLEFLQEGLVDNEKQSRIAAEEAASIPASEDAPAAEFWEKTRLRMLVGGQ